MGSSLRDENRRRKKLVHRPVMGVTDPKGLRGILHGLIFGLLLALVWLGGLGADSGGLPTGAARSDLDRGREVYEANCGICHGVRGDGNGMAAHHFRTRPQNFRTGRFKFRSTPSGSLPLDEDLFRTITQGIGRTGMIPQVHLDEEDRWAVVSYIKTFSPRFQTERPGAPISIPPTPNRTPDLAARGRLMYVEAGCSDCHGEGGRGDGPSAAGLKDEWGNPILPSDLTRLPRKSGPTPPDLYRSIVTGLDGTPMPSYAGALTPEEIWAVVAYLYALPPETEWANLETLVEEELIGFRVEKIHRQPLPPRTPKSSPTEPRWGKASGSLKKRGESMAEGQACGRGWTNRLGVT